MTDSPADTVRSVADVATSLRNYIGQLPPVWIEGQLAEWNPRAKAHYGKLKDLVEDASINITVWNTVVEGLTESFKQGDKVRILAKPDYWVGGGSLSFQVREMRHEGLGDILEKIERLRRTLDAEGLLDPSTKKPLPFLPLCIGLVTGKDSDAEKDVLTNAKLRWADVKFRVEHTLVQGDQAAAQVAAAIANSMPTPRSTSSSWHAAVASSCTSSRSVMSGSFAPRQRAKPRLCQRLVMRTTVRCSTRLPISAPQRPPTRQSGSSPMSRPNWRPSQTVATARSRLCRRLLLTNTTASSNSEIVQSWRARSPIWRDTNRTSRTIETRV